MALRLHAGIKTASFTEEMSLLERDQAAAYFADESGASILLASEIGSEGRNFQFAHHLVLFDLPANADTLEQRIGRLDRIGQSQKLPCIRHLWWVQPKSDCIIGIIVRSIFLAILALLPKRCKRL